MAPWDSGSTSALCSRRQASTRASSMPGAVVARVPPVVAAAGDGKLAGRRSDHPRVGCGQRDQRGLDHGGVLGRAAPLDPGAAGLVVGDASGAGPGGRRVRAGRARARRGARRRRGRPRAPGAGRPSSARWRRASSRRPAAPAPHGPARPGLPGSAVDCAFDHLGLGRREPAVGQCLRRPAPSPARRRRAASRTVAGPVPLWPPVAWVRKSWVDAQPARFTAPVASSSRTTPSSSASSVDFSASTSATVLHQLVGVARRPQRLDQTTHLSAHRRQHTGNAPRTRGAERVRTVRHEGIQAVTTDSFRARIPCVHRGFASLEADVDYSR